MRFAAAAALPVVFVGAARVSHYQKAADEREWSYLPDKTADWYKVHGKPLPELAPAVTTVKEGQSYVVKLECLGCPFRVRALGEVYETWQEPAQDNSLLLNFTIDTSTPLENSLLLNGETIAPYLSLPRPISAFQTPANLSKEVMGKMVSQHMLDASWNLGTKYGQFELQYVHTLLATQDPAEEWLQFDVTGAHRRGINPGSAGLNEQGQKLVQILLHQTVGEDPQTLSIKDIQVIDRLERAAPLRMKCGKLAMLETEFNPLEWDYYGQFGTWSRAWRVFLSKSASFMLHEGPLILVFLALYCGARWFVGRLQNRADAQVKDDAETGLLAPEYEDAPPEYVDDAEDREEKEEGQ